MYLINNECLNHQFPYYYFAMLPQMTQKAKFEHSRNICEFKKENEFEDLFNFYITGCISRR